MIIIKRSGAEVEFDVNKIRNAITKANNETLESNQLPLEKIIQMSDEIEMICNKKHRALGVEEIQDLVEEKIMQYGAFEVARKYIKYRYEREMVRRSNTTDEQILSLIERDNEELKQENSNKNPIINSVQRDYMAGEVSKDLSKRILLPKDIVEAHEKGIIHFHDMDYYAQHMHNCFSGDTKFLTKNGLKAFESFKDGDSVTVYDKDGIERKATVHCYGEQPLQIVIFSRSGFKKNMIQSHSIKCTPNHRWILKDGSVTTNLKVGDELYSPMGIKSMGWKVESIKPIGINIGPIKQKYRVWCIEEPATHSFTLDCGIVTGNCDLVNLEDMLQNGTVISETKIEKPHSFSTACNIATQIIAQVASSQYGGQSISLAHLAPFVQISREKIKKEVTTEVDEGIELKEIKLEKGSSQYKEYINRVVEQRVRKEVARGVQTIQYQVITLLTTNGQAPFVTVFMYLSEAKNTQEKEDLALIIEETLKQRKQGVKNEKGVWITPAFPKLIYVLEEDNIHEDSKYWYLTKLAAECTAKRMVPDYISEKKMKELKEGNCFPVMGCRSNLSPWKDENGNYKFYGRFNQGVVTINLPDVALSSGGDMGKFWDIFDKRLELCYKALMLRHQRLCNTPSDVAPILWQHGALARLKPGETIDRLLYGGYSTISLGYAGLYECTKYMTGKSHTDTNGGQEFAMKVMKHMNEKCEEWKRETSIGFGIYGTPLESTTYKFAKCLQKRFGIIPGVTDKNYITNSYHVHVTEKIDAFSKLAFEAPFQALSTGGAISYIEVPNMQHNIPAVLEVMKFIYNNIMYAELNTKSDYCQVCGYDGEILIEENENGKLIWKCPNCGNTDQDKMNVARRTCGYIGTQFWNQGRTQEIKDRYVHL